MLASDHYDSSLGHDWYPLARVLMEACFRGLFAVLYIFSSS
jgi:hypothetical protein